MIYVEKNMFGTLLHVIVKMENIVSYECECKLGETKCNLNQSWNNDKCQC